MQRGQVTIKDIAKELGISPSTVSRALKDHPDISLKTKMAVNELAEKLNYSPDPIALSLKSRKSKIIGVIVPAMVHYFFSTVIKGIEDVAYEFGYNVMVCNSNESYEREVQNVDALLSSRVEGVLVSVAKGTKRPDHFKKIMNVGVPLVFFDRAMPGLDTDKVIVDDEEGSYQAVRHLVRTGCRKIVHLSAPEHLEISKNRRSGFCRALKDCNIQPSENMVIQCDSEVEANKIIPGILDNDPEIDGFFATNDMTAAAVLRIVKERGLTVPEDISIVGFTNGHISDITDPPLSSVEQFGYKIGEEAARLLINRLVKEDDYPHVVKLIDTEFINKGTSR